MATEGSPKVYCNDSENEFSFYVSCFQIADELLLGLLPLNHVI